MVNYIELSPEVIRLAQVKSRATLAALAVELARVVAEEAIIELDPELELLLDGGEPLSNCDAAVRVLGANDLFVNGKRIDVRVLDGEGNISVCRSLVGTPYLASGSLVVRLEGTIRGAVVGYVGPGAWLSAEEQQSREESIVLPFAAPAVFELSTTLVDLCKRPIVQVPVAKKSLPDATEMEKFLTNQESIIVARRKQIVAAILTNEESRTLLEQVSTLLDSRKVTQTMNVAALWNARVDRFTSKVAPQFPSLSVDEVKTHVRKTGEIFGGQPDSPAFRRHALSTLAREQLMRKFQTAPHARVVSLVEQVLSGRAAMDCIGDLVKNKVAVDIAATIKRARGQVDKFVNASAEEIGLAFNQLALQPVYATHSKDETAGTDAINEALELLEAAEVAEKLRELEAELTSA